MVVGESLWQIKTQIPQMILQDAISKGLVVSFQ